MHSGWQYIGFPADGRQTKTFQLQQTLLRDVQTLFILDRTREKYTKRG